MSADDLEGPPLTFADLGIRTEERVNTGILGTSRKLGDLEKAEWVFVVVTGLGLPATLIISIIKMASTSSHDPDFVFALLLVINSLFCMYYVVHGVLRERPYEVVVLVIATLIVVIYSIVNYSLSKQDSIKLARLILACIIGPLIVGLGLYMARLYHLSGNLIFRTVGANTTLQNFCKTLYFFYGVLKLDLQLGISMVILILSTSARIDPEDIVVLSVGGVFTISWFLIGYISARKENKIGSIVFFAGSLLMPAYIIYKVVKDVKVLLSAQGYRSEVLATCTFVCAGLALCTHIIVVIAMVFVVRNYGNGLKEKAFSGNSDGWPLKKARHRSTYGTDERLGENSQEGVTPEPPGGTAEQSVNGDI